MVEYTFYLSAGDNDKLFRLKDYLGYDYMTGAEYAARELSALINRDYSRHREEIELNLPEYER